MLHRTTRHDMPLVPSGDLAMKSISRERLRYRVYLGSVHVSDVRCSESDAMQEMRSCIKSSATGRVIPSNLIVRTSPDPVCSTINYSPFPSAESIPQFELCRKMQGAQTTHRLPRSTAPCSAWQHSSCFRPHSRAENPHTVNHPPCR